MQIGHIKSQQANSHLPGAVNGLSPMRKNKQSARSFTAFIVTWAFGILTVTGLILYIVPQGRVAYWTHWSLAGLSKEQWGGLHMIFGGLFIVTGVLHLWFNWKPFKGYLADRVAGHLELKREVVTSLLACVIIAVMAVLAIPPISYILDLNAWIKDAWVTSPELEPPFGHAEESSLANIARRMNLDLGQAQTELRRRGIAFDSAQDSLERIARRNQTTPMAVYGLIVHLRREEPVAADAAWTADTIDARFSGTGIGRKSLATIAADIGVHPEQYRARLQTAGIQAEDNETLREIAERRQLSPIDILKVILLDGHRLAE